MLIDWFTVGAQALNFLILVWLMKRFLYKPILQAIETREGRIAKDIADADARKAEAMKEKDEFQHRKEELDQQCAGLLGRATAEAEAQRQKLLGEARQAADAWSAKRQATLQDEARTLNQAVLRRTQQEVLAIARKAMKDLASTSLEERMGEAFTHRLRELDDQAKTSLAEALRASAEPALVRSAFEMPPDLRALVQDALNVTFSAEVRVRFETAPELISGIEFTTHGLKVAWSLSEYLGSLEQGLAELLKAKDEAPDAADPKPATKEP